MRTPEIHHDHDIEVHERATHRMLMPFAFLMALIAIGFICAMVMIYR
jgi:hypothetical protein